MRVITDPPVGTLRTDETLSAVLSPTHDVWIQAARQRLLPATVPNAAFWERWSAVGYLNDQFLERFNAERAVVADLRPLVTAREAEMLLAGGERVAWLRLSLDQIGRRRGTTAEFARVAAEFLKALELWCVEVELAAARVRPGDLSAEARRMLGQLVAPLTFFYRASA